LKPQLHSPRLHSSTSTTTSNFLTSLDYPSSSSRSTKQSPVRSLTTFLVDSSVIPGRHSIRRLRRRIAHDRRVIHTPSWQIPQTAQIYSILAAAIKPRKRLEKQRTLGHYSLVGFAFSQTTQRLLEAFISCKSPYKRLTAWRTCRSAGRSK
jgi:hypothetical protein